MSASVRQNKQPISAVFIASMKAMGTPVEKEFRFHPGRLWKFDWAHVPTKVAIEMEGGAFTQGRHTRGKGFTGDMEKYNAAVMLGWKLLRYTPQQLMAKIPEIVGFIQQQLQEAA